MVNVTEIKKQIRAGGGREEREVRIQWKLGRESVSEVLISNASYVLISQYSHSIILPLFLEQLLLKRHLVVWGFFF